MKYSDFQILDELGRGGNATVSLAEDPSYSQVALKKLNILNRANRANRERKQRFINEIRILKEWHKKINGIMPIYDYSKREYWYTMPIATPVIKYIKDNNLKLDEIVDYFIGLCHTMSELHQNDVSHRDIKPNNIYFYKENFYIGDFGLVDFPDNDNNLTRTDRGLGAVFTIAPEMKRDPTNSDGKKADVYSLAKTLWMLLSLDEKGFDGKYNYFDNTHALNNISPLKSTHIIEIEELISDSTSNDPNDRPSMDEFIKRLENWKSVVSSFSKQQKSQWAFLHKHILNNVGESVIWRDNNKIIEILNKISALNAYNHMFFPDCGGQDFVLAKCSPETNGIEIWDDSNSCNIVFPKALHFESFPEHDEWNYFILELNNVDKIFDSDCYFEELVEDTPAHYVKSTYFQYGVYDYDIGNKYPDGYRLVSRYTGGKILFVLKDGPYNSIAGTYDARHNCGSCEDFRDYIISLITQSSNYAENTQEFFFSEIANNNPFIDKGKIRKTNSKGLIDLFKKHSISAETYLSFKFNLTNDRDNNDAVNAKYYISFYPNDGSPSIPSKEIRLCNDGYLHQMGRDDYEKVLFFKSRELAHKIKNSCKAQLFSGAEAKVYSYFTIHIIGISKPVHLFSKKEIERVMRDADDRKHNTLVIDENGYPRIVCNNELDIKSFPVCHEQWNAGNKYVGKYSNLSTLDETYISSLQGWLLYLQSKQSVRVDYLGGNQDENKLITAIEAIN